MGLEEGVLVGAVIGKDGKLDLSRALRAQAETPKFPDSDLNNFKVGLASAEGSKLLRRSTVNAFAKAHNITPEQALQAVRQYAVNEIKVHEKGDIYHYHQLPIDRLATVLNDKSLLSTEAQKAIGRNLPYHGVRPDVVQMTRDMYAENGKLVKQGLNSADLPNSSRTTFVFKPALMDMPGYEATSDYPNLPSIPINSDVVEAILVERPGQRVETENLLKGAGLNISVKTEGDWTQEHYIQK